MRRLLYTCIYMCRAFLDIVDFKELLNSATGRMKKRSVFNERTEKASASQYFQVRKIKWVALMFSMAFN